jgi:hypothetical protein
MTAYRPSLFVIALLLLGGCAPHGHWLHGQAYERPIGQSVDIPSEDLPPPGKCRLWFPDRPPGHQPPPGECYELSHKVPLGAVLIEG